VNAPVHIVLAHNGALYGNNVALGLVRAIVAAQVAQDPRNARRCQPRAPDRHQRAYLLDLPASARATHHALSDVAEVVSGAAPEPSNRLSLTRPQPLQIGRHAAVLQSTGISAPLNLRNLSKSCT
jgi:hypothetical protein